MNRELLLLRHGKAEVEPVDDDFHRDINDKGKRRTQRIAVWLQQHSLQPDSVISSPATRALTTAQKCCKAMDMAADTILKDERIYTGGDADLCNVLQETLADTGIHRLMLVGHNPALKKLLHHIAGETGKLKPASLVHLHIPQDWNPHDEGSATVKQIVDPATLPKGFPFPAPDGPELRKRPAYYYTQSSVIPYRLMDDGLEVLITRSSQNKHWVVPKGIADPGHRLQDSAAKEAWEEAGVEGEVNDKAIGQYQYQKWGAVCTVTVYAMRVTRQLPDDEWEESHRGRQWLPAGEAASQVRQAEVGDLIMQLKQLMG